MAIPSDLEAQILRYYHAEKWRINTIALQLHVHHGTVSRVLAQAGLPIGAQAQRTGKKPKGRQPREPQPGPKGSDPINLTGEDSRIMPVAGGGFEQAYNTQAAVDAGSMLIVGTGLTQAPNDKEQIEPMLETLAVLKPTLGTVKNLAADTGFYSDNNVRKMESENIVPYIAMARESHHPGWRERHSEPTPLPEKASTAQIMSHRLKTKAGRALYALRKQTVEPVFGIIKSVMGFRQFSMRGLDKVRGEWSLVCLAWNLKRMAVLRPKIA